MQYYRAQVEVLNAVNPAPTRQLLVYYSRENTKKWKFSAKFPHHDKTVLNFRHEIRLCSISVVGWYRGKSEQNMTFDSSVCRPSTTRSTCARSVLVSAMTWVDHVSPRTVFNKS